MSTKNLQRHYSRILQQWPQDNLRSIRFQDAMQRRFKKRLLPSAERIEANAAQAVPATPPNLKAEEAQMNALYSLLENKYARHYAVTEKMMRPLARPSHYEDLAAELERAPNRSWFERQMLRWSKLVRLS